MYHIYCWCRYFPHLTSTILLISFLTIVYCFVSCFYFTVCTTKESDKTTDIEYKIPIDSLETLNKYKGCTEIDGNLIIKIRGSGGSGLLTLALSRIVYINIKISFITRNLLSYLKTSSAIWWLNSLLHMQNLYKLKFYHSGATSSEALLFISHHTFLFQLTLEVVMLWGKGNTS